MKKHASGLYLLLLLIILSTACEKNKNNSIVPEDFKVGMTDAISRPDLDKKSLELDVDGNSLYNHLRTLVWIGEFSADFVNDALATVRALEIEGAGEFSYTSREDFRAKDVLVRQNVDYFNQTWQYGMFISDEDGSPALQLFWNRNPLKGVALLNPGNFNRNVLLNRKAMLKVEYSEDKMDATGAPSAFDKYMIVSVTNLDTTNINFMNKLKMFVGKKDDIVYIRGNSTHPTGYILDDSRSDGVCWTFVAKNNVARDIAVAKVALPPVFAESMTGMWDTYSLKTVLTTEVESVYSNLSPTELDALVTATTANADAPGYFSGSAGFISSGGEVPTQSGFSTEFIDLSSLVPYIPAEVEQMEINFSLPVNK